MANPEHVEILKAGAAVWNAWIHKRFEELQKKKKFEYVPPWKLTRAQPADCADLTGYDFQAADLTGFDFSQTNLNDANLNDAILVNSTFVGASLKKTSLQHAILKHSTFLHTVGDRADFTNADLTGVSFNLSECLGAKFVCAKFYEATLLGGTFAKSTFRKADFTLAVISGADLAQCTFFHAGFSGALLHGVLLGKTKFGRSYFSKTAIADTDLSAATGLHSVIHGGPLSIRIDTIYRSKANIPEVLLRQAGVPEAFMVYARSLTGNALEFYKCFISFTETDDAFSERLYNDLQARGVRCWRWKEDAPWGKTLMRSIDEAIRYYDKLIVICSKESLSSPAVIREIERALQKEDELARTGKQHEVLFPIRLDDYVIGGWEHHRKADVLAKNIGDFREWKDPDPYRKAVDRLVKDLTATKRVD